MALPQLAHHPDHPIHRLHQLLTEPPRTHPHQREEQQIEQPQTDNQQVTDVQVTLRQTIGLAKNIGLIDHQQQLPTRLRNLAPGDQLFAPPKLNFLHIALTSRHGL